VRLCLSFRAHLSGGVIGGQAGSVHPAIDLDAAAILLDRRVTAWRSLGFNVGQVTWRDQGDGWPPVLKTVRAEAVRADSIGIAVRRNSQEGEVVLFDGAWCDLSFWSGDTADSPVQEAPGYPDGLSLDDYANVLDSFISLFG
jgi:hypothetical protein